MGQDAFPSVKMQRSANGDAGAGTQVTDNLRKEVRRLIGTARRAARLIREQDRRLLERRTNIPDALVEQLDKDTEDLGHINRLTGENSLGAARQAQRKVQSILEAWRELLTF